MSLYTLVIDFDGGTYVSQAFSDLLSKAPIECIKNWDISDMSEQISKQNKLSLLEQLITENFVQLDTISNVWCGSCELNGKIVILHLILTVNQI